MVLFDLNLKTLCVNFFFSFLFCITILFPFLGMLLGLLDLILLNVFLRLLQFPCTALIATLPSI